MMTWEPISELVDQVKNGRLSAVELVEESLRRIEKASEYQSIIAVTAERARLRAKEVDEKIATGEEVGILAGVPFVAKDNYLVFGAETTAASNILKGFTAPYQATAIEKLEAAGAICVAKANLDAFAHGASTENSDFFPTKNPHDKTRVPGGSSGGSGAAVVLGIAPFALGSDTGGSIRLPASYCGAVGFKPTYGLVSRSGVVAMGSSLDCMGPLTTRVEDAAIVLDVLAGKDSLDSTTIDRNENGYQITSKETPKGKRIGIIKEYIDDGVDSDVVASINNARVIFTKLGYTVEEISLPSLPLGLAVYYIICPAEVSSNLSRYDGLRFGFSASESTSLSDKYNKTRSIGFGKEAKRRIMLGTYVLSSGYYDAYYKKAQIVRTKLINEFNDAFKRYDFLIGPVAPTTAFKLGQNTHDPLQMYLVDIMTVSASLAGLPAISVPNGHSEDKLPIGLQIMSKQKNDREVLLLARQYEQEVSV